MIMMKVNKEEFKSLFNSNCKCGICTGVYNKKDSDCQVRVLHI